MRVWLFFLILVMGIAFSANFAVRAEEEKCLICEDLKGLSKALRSSDEARAWAVPLSADLAALMATPKYNQVEILKFDIHDVCNAPKIQRLLATPNAYIQSYETLMAGTQACTQVCSVGINAAEYCALNTALSFQINAWPKLSEAFADTAILLDMAGEAERPSITQFSIFLDGAAREAQSYLGQAMQNLVENIPPASDDPRLALARKELVEAGNILQVLHWMGMANPSARISGKKLVHMARALPDLNADLETALGRAQVLAPKDRRALAKRIMVMAADMALIRQSALRAVGDLQQSEPDTNANATNPLAESALDLGTIGTCLNTLAIETSMVPEFGKGVQDELNTCRSFANCPDVASFAKPMDLQVLIERIEANVGKDEKIAMAVSRKICK